MTQPVHPPEETTRPVERPLADQEATIRQPGLIVMFVMSGLALMLFIALTFGTYMGFINTSGTKPVAAGQTPTPTPVTGWPLTFPTLSTTPITQLALPTNHALLFEQLNDIYLVPIINQPVEGANTPNPTPDPRNKPQALHLPGYRYNRSASPILTPSGQLIYSGDGIWETTVLHGQPKRIATLAEGQTITSLILSNDGSTLAWSTAPITGVGRTTLYTERLGALSQQVYQQEASACPCFRIFSFIEQPGKQANSTLLLTDDRGDHNRAQFGLWSLDLAQAQRRPIQLLSAAPAQGPVLFNDQDNTLLYSNNKMLVPLPNDRSMPLDLASEQYANSLYIASINRASSALQSPQQILPAQKEQSNIGNYRWITTPTFAPGGQTLIYVVFAADGQDPYGRHSSLYTVQMDNAGSQLHAEQPQLLAAATSSIFELGPWLNSHIVTFYADGWIYALDIQSNEIARITNTQAYVHIIGAV